MPMVGSATSAAVRPGRGRFRVFQAALFLGCVAVVLWHASRLTVLWDLSYILEHAWRISLGDVPYRDFAIPHPPLTFVIQAALMRVLDGGYRVHLAYCAIVAGLTAAVTSRIVRFQLEEDSARADLHAFLLTVPLLFLNGYCILSQPFYDPDCAFWLLLALFAVLSARSHGTPGWRHLLAGALIVVPVFFKQNIGLPGLAATHGCLLLSAILHANERRPYLITLCGSLLALIVAFALIYGRVGIAPYYYWTITYAAGKRPFVLRRVLFIYENWRTWLAVACGAAGVVLAVQHTLAPARRVGYVLIALPLTYASLKVFQRPLSWEAPYFWAMALVGGVLVAANDFLRGRCRFESLLPVVAAAVVHGSFMSQGVGGSSYGVWPFLILALAAPAALLIARAPASQLRDVTVLLALAATLLVAVGYLHVARDERLLFADTQGPVERAALSRMQPLSVPGAYLGRFEAMTARCTQLVPVNESVVLLPGEDPFFFATRRAPRFPALMFDDTITPYSAAQVQQMLRDRGIEWVIVKTVLQLRESPWSEMGRLDLSRDYRVVEQLPGYIVWRRKFAGA